MSLVRFFYSLLFYLASPYVLWRLFKRRGATPWQEYFGYGQPLSLNDAPLVWIHAVSLGEAIAALGLAKHLQSRGYRLLWTHTTKSGGDWLRQQRDVNAHIVACPLDFPGATTRFMNKYRPQLVVFIEAEFWPNLLSAATSAGVKIFLANARLSKKSAKRYAHVKNLMKEMVARFDTITTQTTTDAERLAVFGSSGSIVTTGNLKFDRTIEQQALINGRKWREEIPLKGKKIILISATREGEEKLILSAMGKSFFDDYFVILAPRHPERINEIIPLVKHLRYSLRSQNTRITDEDLYLVDSLGEMDFFYAASDVALICGSFLPYGGQNPIEAMAAGCAVVVGPYMNNYEELVHEAKSSLALRQSANPDEAAALLKKIASDEIIRKQMSMRAQELCIAHSGALNKTTALLDELLNRGEK